MGDENSVLTRSEARHLLRRTGFGADPRQLDHLVLRGSTRGEVVDNLLDFDPKKFKPRGKQIEDVHNKWVKYMVRTKYQLQEKLVLFWHDHFATGNAKVNNAELMTNQNLLFRLNCKGNFKDLVKAVNKDAAMMEYLDTVRNSKNQPNENYAREVEELFTLGVKDSAGNANYTQADIVQIARAFTGWDYDDDGLATFDSGRHDYANKYPARGPKVIYTTVGQFGSGGRSFTVNGEGEPEIDTVIDIIFDHRDTNSHNTVARHIGGKLISYFAFPSPPLSLTDAVIADSGFDTSFDINSFLRALFVRDEFYANADDPVSVKWPVDYVVSTLNLLRMKLKSKYQYVDGGDGAAIRDQLLNMGQVLLDPPSVFGWDWETAWISSATLLARCSFTRDATAARAGGGTSLRPEKLIDLTLTDPGDVVDAVADRLGVNLTATERSILINYLTDNHPNTPVDLNDPDTRDGKLHGLFGLILQSPAYQLH